MAYAGWLRGEFEFPVPVRVSCERGRKLRCRDVELAFGVLFSPYDRRYRPEIRLACGDFAPDEPITDALCDEEDGIMLSLTHEIVHYFQYINGFDMSRSRSVEWQATYWSKRIFRYFNSLYDEETPPDPPSA